MDQECQTCGVEAQSHETQTLKIDCVSHEVQTEHQDARAPKGYYVVCMYGDSHMKTCYRYLLQLLEPDTDINLVHENHPRENILIDRSFSVNFREYHSNYVCHKRKLFIEYVFVRTVFDTYLESHMLKHHLSGSSIDLIFINSALWDIKNRAGCMEYERRVHCFHEHVQMLTKEKRGLLRVVGIIFNAIDPAVIPVGSPFFLCKNSIIENLGSRIRWYPLQVATLHNAGKNLGKHSPTTPNLIFFTTFGKEISTLSRKRRFLYSFALRNASPNRMWIEPKMDCERRDVVKKIEFSSLESAQK
jgi:hypothetical protein